MDFADIIVIFATLVWVFGVFCAGLAIWETRTSQGAIAWAIGLITAPYIAVPLYLVFGRRKFRGYVTARRTAEIEAHQITAVADTLHPDRSMRSARELGQMRVLETLADMPFTKGNDARLLIDGRATFDAIFAAIDEARHYVLVQFYIIRDDGLGTELAKRLIAATERGVHTYLLYDEVGSGPTRKAYFQAMADAGVHVSEFGSRRGQFNRFQLNFRNHRKIVVVDGRVAFVGGSNVGDEYLGLDPKFGDWRDTHVELYGPIVQGAQLSFQEDWFWAQNERLEVDWALRPADDADKIGLMLATGPADRHESCSLFFVMAINAAVERIWIVSPYFVPDLDVIHALQLAALRGVDVRIIVPDKADHLIVWLAAFSYFEEMADEDIRFFKYTRGFLHQKVMLVDNEASAIGTANMDNRSFRLNFEVTALIIDDEFNNEVADMIEADLENCREYDQSEYENKPFWFKLGVRMARLASPIL